jgi:hypothetical protein
VWKLLDGKATVGRVAAELLDNGVPQFIGTCRREGMAFGRPDTDGQDAAVRPRKARSAVAAPW